MDNNKFIKQETERLINKMIEELKKQGTDLNKLAGELDQANLSLESKIADDWGQDNEDIDIFN